jgi:hypothetical protein
MLYASFTTGAPTDAAWLETLFSRDPSHEPRSEEGSPAISGG